MSILDLIIITNNKSQYNGRTTRRRTTNENIKNHSSIFLPLIVGRFSKIEKCTEPTIKKRDTWKRSRHTML